MTTSDDIWARFRLTPRQREVASCLRKGLSDREIAGELGISWFTARSHVEQVLQKCGVRNRRSLMRQDWPEVMIRTKMGQMSDADGGRVDTVPMAAEVPNSSMSGNLR